MTWLVESVRFTGFFKEPVDMVKQDWWEQLLGVSPDTSDIQRAEQRRTDVGVLEGLNIVLQVTAPRFDLIISAAGQELNPAIVPIADESKVVPDITKGVISKLSELPSVIRIALGVTAVMPVPERIEGYKLLDKFLPSLTIDPEGSQDLIYRINRPRLHELGGTSVKINRVATWTVRQKMIMMQRLVASGVPEPGQAPVPIHTSHGVQCEMDFSTDQTRGEVIAGQELSAGFALFVEYARETLEKGDVA